MFTKMSIVESQRVNRVPESWVGTQYIHRPHASEIAKLMNDAFEFTAARSKKSTDEVKQQMMDGDLWANSTFRYALAKGIRKNLSANPMVQDLYVYGSVMDDQARMTSDINLILHVKEDKTNFESWIELLDEGLVEQFRKEFNLSGGFKTLIDCHVVTDEEVSRRAGYASLLSSIHTNVTQIN